VVSLFVLVSSTVFIVSNFHRLETIRKSVGKQPHWSTDDMSFILEAPLSHDTNTMSHDRHSRHKILSELFGNEDEESELNRSFSCDKICQLWIDQQSDVDESTMDNVPISAKTSDVEAPLILNSNGMESPSVDSSDIESPSIFDSNDIDSPWMLESKERESVCILEATGERSPSITLQTANPPKTRTRSTGNTSGIPPMRKRSSCFSFKSSRKNSRFSQFSIEIPSAVLRERRRPSTLLGVLHDSKGPLELLSLYQFLSLGASADLTTINELRTIICGSHKNTEAVNYKMSYLREPH